MDKRSLLCFFIGIEALVLSPTLSGFYPQLHAGHGFYPHSWFSLTFQLTGDKGFPWPTTFRAILYGMPWTNWTLLLAQLLQHIQRGLSQSVQVFPLWRQLLKFPTMERFSSGRCFDPTLSQVNQHSRGLCLAARLHPDMWNLRWTSWRTTHCRDPFNPARSSQPRPVSTPSPTKKGRSRATVTFPVTGDTDDTPLFPREVRAPEPGISGGMCFRRLSLSISCFLLTAEEETRHPLFAECSPKATSHCSVCSWCLGPSSSCYLLPCYIRGWFKKKNSSDAGSSPSPH